ncbi:MAG TPA: asparagine synthetase B family protein [Terracidiphilus sp.]|nr:asparagine synthetase B family protein [Terracidiphilus sp.]
MSQQAGIWHFDQRPVSAEQFAAFDHQLTMQGPDNRGEYSEPGFAMLHRAFYITQEDALETQPIRDIHGAVLTWDGRLDNRDELLADLGRTAYDLPTDAEIVAAALAAWDAKALPRLIGDWALAWWNSRCRRLLLARDYIGIRKLYYLASRDSLLWSTDLAALVLHSGHQYTLCDTYFAGYFTTYPEPQLTPYREIQLVPPGGYLDVTPDKLRVKRYWSFNRLTYIKYKTDAEYEEHFRQVFRQSVRRRLRTAYPILADLSGGLDSSSIVCMAYDILKAGEARATINTISHYSTEEPGGDERPYFTAVEEFIGKTGTHIESCYEVGKLLRPVPEPYFASLPGYFDRMLEGERRLLVETGHQGNRMHFSGLGGDELLGGVQNPVPDLAGLLWHLRLPSYFDQLTAWALQRKTTVWSLAGRSIVYLLPVGLRAQLDRSENAKLAGWLRPEFVREQNIARRRLQTVATEWSWLPGPPSPDSGYLSLAASTAGYLPRFTFAEQSELPYYDRDLVQFLFAIPGEQVLRPRQRRSLMRRGLKSIVPDVVLSRKTKALGRRVPALEMLENAAAVAALLPGTPIADRYVDPAKMREDLERLREGKEVSTLLLERVLATCFLYCDALFAQPRRRADRLEVKTGLEVQQ